MQCLIHSHEGATLLSKIRSNSDSKWHHAFSPTPYPQSSIQVLVIAVDTLHTSIHIEYVCYIFKFKYSTLNV